MPFGSLSNPRKTNAQDRPKAWVIPLVMILAMGSAVGLPIGCAGPIPESQRLERYLPLLKRPLTDRVLPADDAVISRAHRTNLDYGMDVLPRATPADHPLAQITRRVLAELPTSVARLAYKHLAAIYLVEGDVGTATTEAVGQRGSPWRHAYIVLNATSLTRKANDWATWKERSTFLITPGAPAEASFQNGPRMVIETPEHDDLEGAVRFILLHELGHVIGLGLRVHRPWEDDNTPPPQGGYPFPALSWRSKSDAPGGKLISRTSMTHPLPHHTDFYAFDKAPLAMNQANAVYRQLSETHFPSLYGATNHWDDFAETFVIYVHTRLLNKPYRVEVLENGKSTRIYRSCLQRETCPAKTAFLAELLGRSF